MALVQGRLLLEIIEAVILIIVRRHTTYGQSNGGLAILFENSRVIRQHSQMKRSHQQM